MKISKYFLLFFCQQNKLILKRGISMCPILGNAILEFSRSYFVSLVFSQVFWNNLFTQKWTWKGICLVDYFSLIIEFVISCVIILFFSFPSQLCSFIVHWGRLVNGTYKFDSTSTSLQPPFSSINNLTVSKFQF